MKILPIIRKIFTPKSVKVVKPNIIKTVEIVSSSAQNPVTVKNENPALEWIYKMYKQDGVSREVVDRVVLGGERLRYYRYVGEEELQKVLNGSRITSSRPCHNGNLTDVTSNPHYDRIPTMGKYRLTFKDKPEFAPYPLGNEKNSRILEHNLGNQEFYIRGGYDISDIEKVEQKLGDGRFLDIKF